MTAAPPPGWASPGRLPDVSLAEGCEPGRVVRVDRSAYDVLTASGTRRIQALADDVAVGDWLAVDPSGGAVVLPRSTALLRGAASGRSRPQALAANVDVVLVCAALCQHLPVRRIERLLTLAWDSGATPVVVLTKADLHPSPHSVVETLRPHAPGVDVVTVMAGRGDVGSLARWSTPGATLVLLGASGAGKSTVVNALAGKAVMSTGDIRDVDGKGRHTTTHRQLVVLPSGAVVIDTPGLRGVGLTGTPEGLSRAFADVEDVARACRFADCVHHGEPGCAVRASLDAGDLTEARMDSWRQLQRELAFQTRRTDARLRAADKAVWRARTRQQRERGGRP